MTIKSKSSIVSIDNIFNSYYFYYKRTLQPQTLFMEYSHLSFQTFQWNHVTDLHCDELQMNGFVLCVEGFVCNTGTQVLHRTLAGLAYMYHINTEESVKLFRFLPHRPALTPPSHACTVWSCQTQRQDWLITSLAHNDLVWISTKIRASLHLYHDPRLL